MCAAAKNTETQRKVALVIGNTDYKDSALENCVNDANDLDKALKSIGFTVTIGINLDFEKMDRLTAEFATSIQPNDFVVFFFSGHGMQSEDQNYLIPCDDDKIKSSIDLKYRAVNAQRVLDLMLDQNPFVVVYLLDCCRVYSTRGTSKAKSLGGSSKGMAQMPSKQGTVIAYACAPGTVAADAAPNGRNGMFTYHLLQHITRPGENVIMLLTDVAAGVVNDTRRQQIPHTTTALTTRDVYFVPPQTSTGRQKGEDFTVANTCKPLDEEYDE